MWILPKNYQLSSAFAAGMVASKEDLTLPGLNIESSLMWRSKPSLSRTWLQRWNRVSWFQPLSLRILKPSRHTCFEEQLTSSLEAIRVSRLVRPESDAAQMTQDTCGPTYGDTSQQLDLLNASLKTSRDTSRLDSPASSAIWKKMVIEARGEYSQRVKLAHRTRESESTSWATPNTMDHLTAKSPETLIRQSQTVRKGRTSPSNLREQVDPVAVQIYQGEWPTPTTQDNIQVAGQYKNPKSGTTLGGAVRNWPTPRASEYKDCGPVGSKSHANMKKKYYLSAEAKEESMPRGQLNPDWVEWLMGVPTGWTELGSWGTE